MRCEMNGIDVDVSLPCSASTSAGTSSRPLRPPNEEPQTRRPVISSAGNDVERLALARDAADRAQPPAHARRLDRLAHHRDVARSPRTCSPRRSRRSSRGSRSTASGPPSSSVGRALTARELEPLRRQVDAHDPLGALQAAAGDRAEPDHPGAEDDARRARAHRRPCASPRRGPSRARRRTGRRGRAAPRGSIFASAISGITVYSANVEVPMKWRSGSPRSDRRVVPSGR